MEPPLIEIEIRLLAAVAAERGHFRYESGHHGDLWLDLDRLLIDAGRTRALASALAERAVGCRPEIVCGPLSGGAFVAQFVAAEIRAGFVFAERIVAKQAVTYRIPGSIRPAVRRRRVLLVDDAVNAGSALLATRQELLTCGAELAGCASLLALGDAAARITAATGAPFYRLATLERGMWPPGACPLCAAGAPLVDPVPAA